MCGLKGAILSSCHGQQEGPLTPACQIICVCLFIMCSPQFQVFLTHCAGCSRFFFVFLCVFVCFMVVVFFFLVAYVLGCLFCVSLVSWGRLLLLWISLWALLILNPIGFGLLCFHYHLFLCIFFSFPFYFFSNQLIIHKHIVYPPYICIFNIFSCSVQFICSVMSDYLQPHESQHARPPCPSPVPGVYSNSCPLSWWCNQTISPSVVHFSSCPPSLPTSGSLPMSQLFTWGGQSIAVSASASVLPMNTQDWSPVRWTGWISLQSKGLSRVLYNTTIQKHQLFGAQLSSQSNSHIHTWPLGKP